MAMRLARHLLRLALVLLCLVVSISASYASELAQKQKSYWGIYTGDAGGAGVAIQGVETVSPGALAGLQSGDVLLSVNGVTIKSPQEFRAVKNTFPLYTPLNLAVKRNGALIERQILLSGIVALEVKAVKSEFTIPGVPLPPTPSTELSAIDVLEVVNVLDQVILDPKSGKIAILGHYDKNYNTGPIPYLDLLKTALVYPEPILNIMPTPETKPQLLDRMSRPTPKFEQ
jgi:membrane-associated protease RseP (regulator of RpoE activity)